MTFLQTISGNNVLSMMIFIVMLIVIVGLVTISVVLYFNSKKKNEQSQLAGELNELREKLNFEISQSKKRDEKIDLLTKREVQILEKIAISNMISKEIANELNIAKGTVDNHIKNIYGKLGCNSRTAVTKYYYENLN